MGKPLDIVIRGKGITGCALALALAPLGLRMGWVAGPARTPHTEDVRAYSLNASARQLLEGLGAWPDATHTGAVRQIAVWGDGGGEIRFEAPSGQPLSWMVEVHALEALLLERARALPHLTWLSEPVEAELTAICEGRASETRRAWGVPFERHPYPQQALAFRVRHDLPHQACARQWFSGAGDQAAILALLPLADAHHSAVVWSLPTGQALTLQAGTAAALQEALGQATGHALGGLQLCSERALWPLQSAQARHWCGEWAEGQRFVLVGDAAHNIHPLAGLGLNLGLDDVSALAEVLAQRKPIGRQSGVGAWALLRQYERRRKLAVGSVNAVCDGLQLLFAHPSGLTRWARNTGLSCVDHLGFLKQWVMARATHLESGT
ncbi:MAG: hypothetical protein RIT26_893 [Pseudomonadota bacterium]|jgi:2-polyprenyl-6-methoxyphenol hydroxylase-like FAD-dependent oxidoreductase